jgi:hypothetical protein
MTNSTNDGNGPAPKEQDETNPYNLSKRHIHNMNLLYEDLISKLKRRHGEKFLRFIYNRSSGITVEIQNYDTMLIDNQYAWDSQTDDSATFIASGFYINDGIVLVTYTELSFFKRKNGMGIA